MRTTKVCCAILILLLMQMPMRCLAESNDPWVAAGVPANDWGDFFAYYQRFLRERLPRDVRKTGDKAADHAAKLENHRELASLTARLSEVCNAFAHSGMFPAAAGPEIKKEDKNKIPGTWNLYRNVPPNAADLWQESCHLRFLSLLHESEVDFDRLGLIRDYADQVAKFETLQKLHVRMKRVWYAKTLDRVELASDTNPEVRSLESEVLLAEAIRDFHPFLMRYLSVEHIELAERFVTIAGVCPSEEISELLHSLIDEAAETATKTVAGNKEQQPGTQRGHEVTERSDRTFPAAHELVERIDLLSGLLRRQELIGKPMPVWGVDLAGNVFDEKTLEGKVVLLDFWATWCAPCVAEFPHLKNLYEKYHDRGFEIIGFNVDSDLEQLSAFLERRLLPWPVLVREKSLGQDAPPLSTYYGARKLPIVILCDRQGNVISLDARSNGLDEILERLFE
ncbi:MAG: TlpA family protein disulfide reductase [Planctomycetaceae bacterium]|nr:TlpA family protein disulfide reductase [Planctomycetaceae bacterium]